MKVDLNEIAKSISRFPRDVDIPPEALAGASLNPMPNKISAPRQHMFASHMGQKPALLYGEPPLLYTGSEREYAKRLHVIQATTDMRVIEVITKYAKLTPRGQNAPLTLIVYEDMKNNKVDALEVPHHYCNHQTLGFRYIFSHAMKNIYPGQCISEGTILAHPPTLNNDGDWTYGRNVMMALIPSLPGIEDGLCISESTAKNFSMTGYGKVEMKFGKNKIPLNTYGDEKHYIPFPSIGDKIKKSGIIMFCRDFDIDLAPANMTRQSLRRPNQTDTPVYGVPGAKIVDIQVIKSSNQSNNLPPEVEEFVARYDELEKAYQRSINKVNNRLEEEYGTEAYPSGGHWLNLCARSFYHTDPRGGTKKEEYRGKQLDDYQVIITYEYTYVPNLGSKFTGLQGDKAVVTRIRPDHEMPEYAPGKHVDAYMDDTSTSNRMNSPRLDCIAITSCGEAARDEILEHYHAGRIKDAWDVLYEAMTYISPKTAALMLEITDENIMREDLAELAVPDDQVKPGYTNRIRFLMESNNPVDYVKAIPAFAERFPPLKQTLILTNDDGTRVETIAPSLVGWLYMIPLERLANKFSAVSSAKRQHHGMPVKPSKQSRTASPINDSPTRDKGEDETRGYEALLGGNVIAENYDRNLNPKSHRQELRSIYGSENPARIRNTVPRSVDQIDPTVQRQEIIPMTGGRVVAIRDHIMRCGGYGFTKGQDGDAVW